MAAENLVKNIILKNSIKFWLNEGSPAVVNYYSIYSVLFHPAVTRAVNIENITSQITFR